VIKKPTCSQLYTYDQVSYAHCKNYKISSTFLNLMIRVELAANLSSF